MERLAAHRMAVIGLIVWAAEIILVLVLPAVLRLDPYTSDPLSFYGAPSAAHVLGTDAIGQIGRAHV